MQKIHSIDELKKIKESLNQKYELSNNVNKIRVRVAMATCSIAAGSRDTIKSLEDTIKKEGLEDIQIIQTGCLGFCYAEPTVEVTKPGEQAVIFRDVDAAKAAEIVSQYIKKGKNLSCVIPQNYKTID